MDFEKILGKCLEQSPNQEEALLLLQASRTPDKAIKIFAAACEVRDRELGRVFKLDSEIAPVAPCKIKPFCNYCTFSREVLTPEEVLEGLKLAEETGIADIRLSGGSDLTNDGSDVVELVRLVKANTTLRVHLNIGPVYSKENLVKLKELGVIEVGSSLETINPEVFKRTKPGDSLDLRIETARAINNTGLKLQSIIMAGLGSFEKDYIKHLFFLKELKNLSHLPISRFNPFKGTPMENRRRASPWEAARLCSVARLTLRTPDIRIAAGGGPDDIPLWLMAGGNRITSVFIHQEKCEPERFSGENPLHIRRNFIKNMEVVDRSSICRSFAEEAGFEVYPAQKQQQAAAPKI
jgi:biotin synthase